MIQLYDVLYFIPDNEWFVVYELAHLYGTDHARIWSLNKRPSKGRALPLRQLITHPRLWRRV